VPGTLRSQPRSGWDPAALVGLDHSPDALARARDRAEQRGLAQVQFIEGDVHDPAPGGPYDAIVERLTLWQVPDPAVVLRRQATVLRPGGLVVPLEKDSVAFSSEPELSLCTQTCPWIVQAFAKIGSALPTMGRRLWAIAEEAGLCPLGMTAVLPQFGPGDENGLAFWLETIRNGCRSWWAPAWSPPRSSISRRMSSGLEANGKRTGRSSLIPR
jgi:SAM-dependent methyltransferase